MPREHTQQTCYMCEKHATTREHAPCKSFFPETDQLSGINYRKNLITVPSCDEHNSSKSKDDEYLLFVILSAGANAIACQLFSSKVMRAFGEKAYLAGLITRDMQPAFYNGSPTMTYVVDELRLINSIIHLAHAIYYHHFMEKWSEEMSIFSPTLLARGDQEAQSMNAASMLASNVMERMLLYTPQHGENPTIFYYKIHYDKEVKLLFIRMVFYEGMYCTPKTGQFLGFPYVTNGCATTW